MCTYVCVDVGVCGCVSSVFIPGALWEERGLSGGGGGGGWKRFWLVGWLAVGRWEELARLVCIDVLCYIILGYQIYYYIAMYLPIAMLYYLTYVGRSGMYEPGFLRYNVTVGCR